MKTEKQDESLLDTLVTWLSKQSQEKSVKGGKEEEKSISNSIIKLAESLSLVALEVAKLTKTVSDITKVVNEHSELIQDLYTVQNGILNMLKTDASVQQASKTLSLINNDKKKTEKPN